MYIHFNYKATQFDSDFFTQRSPYRAKMLSISGPNALSLSLSRRSLGRGQRSLCRVPAFSAWACLSIVFASGLVTFFLVCFVRWSPAFSLSGPGALSVLGPRPFLRRGLAAPQAPARLRQIRVDPTRSRLGAPPRIRSCYIRACGPPAPIRVAPIPSHVPHPVRGPLLQSARHPSGPRAQLRSVCHPPSPAHSLFPGENPKPYYLGEYMLNRTYETRKCTSCYPGIHRIADLKIQKPKNSKFQKYKILRIHNSKILKFQNFSDLRTLIKKNDFQIFGILDFWNMGILELWITRIAFPFAVVAGIG